MLVEILCVFRGNRSVPDQIERRTDTFEFAPEFEIEKGPSYLIDFESETRRDSRANR